MVAELELNTMSYDEVTSANPQGGRVLPGHISR